MRKINVFVFYYSVSKKKLHSNTLINYLIKISFARQTDRKIKKF